MSKLLSRIHAIPRAAKSISSERPKALRHFETLEVQKDILPPPEIVLIDDFVTSGAALLGSAARLRESYPSVPIRGFAAIRTISTPSKFVRIKDPVVGSITLRSDGLCRRVP